MRLFLCLTPIMSLPHQKRMDWKVKFASHQSGDKLSKKLQSFYARQQEKNAFFKEAYGQKTPAGLYKTTVLKWAGGQRGLHDLRTAPDHERYPEEFLDPANLMGLKVLDVGTSEGVFVKDLLKATKGNITIFGLDRDRHRSTEDDPLHFVFCDAQKTDFPDQTFDVIYVTWSVFTYDFESDLLKKAVLKELERVLVEGGRIRMTPVNKSEIEGLVRSMGETRLKVHQEGNYAVDVHGNPIAALGTFMELIKEA